MKLTKESIINEIGDDFQLKLEISFKLSHWHWALIGLARVIAFVLVHIVLSSNECSCEPAHSTDSPEHSLLAAEEDSEYLNHYSPTGYVKIVAYDFIHGSILNIGHTFIS